MHYGHLVLVFPSVWKWHQRERESFKTNCFFFRIRCYICVGNWNSFCPAICNRCPILPIQTPKYWLNILPHTNFYLNLSIFFIGKCRNDPMKIFRNRKFHIALSNNKGICKYMYFHRWILWRPLFLNYWVRLLNYLRNIYGQKYVYVVFM